MKHVNKTFLDKAFTYHITGYDNMRREYILLNTATKEVKRIPKDDVEAMMREQHHDAHNDQHNQPHH